MHAPRKLQKLVLIITKHSSALYIGIAKVLPIIDVLGYDGQNSSFSSSPPPPPPYSDSTPITQKEAIYQHETLWICRFP